MPWELFGRICVGGLLKPEAAQTLHTDFLQSLELPETTTPEDLFERLRWDVPKHKLHEPDRVRYERAFEEYIDKTWDVDFALGGLSTHGLFESRRGYIFVGIRVEQFEVTLEALPTKAASPERPQWLRKGDLTVASEIVKDFDGLAKKAWSHAARSYARAGREILQDAHKRLKTLPISKQHDIDWALCRWLVDSEHDSARPRHGGRTSEE